MWAHDPRTAQDMSTCHNLCSPVHQNMKYFKNRKLVKITISSSINHQPTTITKESWKESLWFFYLWEFHQNHLCLLNIDPRYQIEKKKLPIWRKNTSKIEKNISRESSQIQMKMLIVHTIKSKLRAYNLSLRAGREDEVHHHGKVSNEHSKLPLATWPHPQLLTRSLGLDTAPTKKSFNIQTSDFLLSNDKLNMILNTFD